MIEGNTETYELDLLPDVYKNISWEYQYKAEEEFDKSFKAQENKFEHCWLEIRYSLISIIFAVLSIEGYINRLGNEELEPMIWKEFERLSLDKKFIIFPKLVFNKTLDTSSIFFKSFRQIIDLRNILVHYKCRLFKTKINHPSGIEVPLIWKYANSFSASIATRIAVKLFIIIDNNFNQKCIDEITKEINPQMIKLNDMVKK